MSDPFFPAGMKAYARSMSDGNEERHESKVREQLERREDPEDRIDYDNVDEGQPERADS